MVWMVPCVTFSRDPSFEMTLLGRLAGYEARRDMAGSNAWLDLIDDYQEAL